MKTLLKTFVVTAALCALAVPALAGGPVWGNYTSSGADVSHGRYTESYNGGSYLQPDNVIETQSWDGATLATQYAFSCGVLVSTNLVLDNTDVNGTGTKVYEKTFTGGTFWMNGTGEAWDGGDASYTGTISTYIETVTILFVFGNRTSATSNIQGSGAFDNYPTTCITWTANGADVLSAVAGAGYPDYLDTSCGVIGGSGRSGNRTDYDWAIDSCVVPTEESTWGAIKELFE